MILLQKRKENYAKYNVLGEMNVIDIKYHPSLSHIDIDEWEVRSHLLNQLSIFVLTSVIDEMVDLSPLHHLFYIM